MRIGIVTFVYNESLNLPIWLKYYSGQFGAENLFVVDRGSDDGSTQDLGGANLIRVPRKEFDEIDKTNFMTLFHQSLLSFYDAVIITDCDEIIVADPASFSGIPDFLEKTGMEYVNCIGLDLTHIIDRELAFEPDRPVLSQRNWVKFHPAECKPLISRVAMKWLPGFHTSNRPPAFHPGLFLFHLKYLDLNFALQRQHVNLGTVWSERSVQAKFGAHHRTEVPDFVHRGFLVPMDQVKRGLVTEFDFQAECESIVQQTKKDAAGFYRIPMSGFQKFCTIPDKFSSAF
jgi:hypothetical protein